MGQHIRSHAIGGPACSSVWPCRPERLPRRADRGPRGARAAEPVQRFSIGGGDVGHGRRHYTGVPRIIAPRDEPPLTLSLRGITKAFPGVVANDRVDLDIQAGEVHAVVGENGAGKSTLAKILYGFYRADAGDDQSRGARRSPSARPQDARALGIGMVFQDLVQVPAFTVAENVALFLPDLPAVLGRAALAAAHRDDLAALRPGHRSGAPRCGDSRWASGRRWRSSSSCSRRRACSSSTSRRAAWRRTRSPACSTSSTTLKRDGYAVVLIAHKLAEVLAVADRITVMRRGRVVGSLPRAEATEAALVSLMFEEPMRAPAPRAGGGGPGGAATDHRAARCQRARRGRTAAGSPGSISRSRRASWSAWRACRATGSASSATSSSASSRCAAGSKCLEGQDATALVGGPGARRRRGVRTRGRARAWPPCPSSPCWRTRSSPTGRRYARAGGLASTGPPRADDLTRAFARLGFTVPSLDAPLGTLSGGNVQRAVLARELAHAPG